MGETSFHKLKDHDQQIDSYYYHYHYLYYSRAALVTATVVGLATGYGLVIEKQLHQNLQVVQIDSLLLLTLKVLRISTRYSKCFAFIVLNVCSFY